MFYLYIVAIGVEWSTDRRWKIPLAFCTLTLGQVTTHQSIFFLIEIKIPISWRRAFGIFLGASFSLTLFVQLGFGLTSLGCQPSPGLTSRRRQVSPRLTGGPIRGNEISDNQSQVRRQSRTELARARGQSWDQAGGPVRSVHIPANLEVSRQIFYASIIKSCGSPSGFVNLSSSLSTACRDIIGVIH